MYTKPLHQICAKDAALAGGKGASLGEMIQSGIPVPGGFVVLAATFDRFLHETGILTIVDSLLGKVDHTTIHILEDVSEEIQELILTQDMPENMQKEIMREFLGMQTSYVAVRSSATAEDGAEHAWAGQLETYLNTTQDTLLKHVKHCWASLFSPRALFYRFEKGLNAESISVAVVVQKMVQSEKSGIAFSVHPVTQDRNQLIIEAGFGLGEAIVSGSVTPDSYVVTKLPFEVEDIYISEQTKALYKGSEGGSERKDIFELGKTQVLSGAEVLELSKIVLTIEKHYNFPCDIERVYEGGTFYITQSRPITTLGGDAAYECDGDIACEIPDIDGGKRQFAYNRNISFFQGSILVEGYYDSRLSFGIDTHYRNTCFFRHGKNITLFIEEEEFKVFKNDIIHYLAKRENIEQLWEHYFSYGKQFLDISHQLFTSPSLEVRDSYVDIFRIYGGTGLIITGQIGRIGLDLLQDRLHVLGYKDERLAEVIQIISYPKEHTPMFDAQLALVELGKRIQKNECSEEEKESALQEWLRLYGFIPVNFVEKPRTYADAVQQLQDILEEDCSELYLAMQQNHMEKVQSAQDMLQKINDEEVQRLAYALQDATYLNEYRKNVFCKISLEIQSLFKSLAEKLKIAEREDFYYLTHQEVRKILSGEYVDIPSLKAEREYACLYIDKKGNMQMLEDKVQLEKLRRYVSSLYDGGGAIENGNELTHVQGTSANRGVVRGTVKIVMKRSEFGKFEAGDILVTSMTSVDFVPIMRLAAAFVTNEGGITSHASIVARELNKPCIIGTKNATSVFQDGDKVEVNANTGLVKLLFRSKINKSLSDIEKILPRLVKFATRPQTVQRDNMIIDFCGKLYGVEVITVPLDGNNRGFYMDEQSLRKVYDALYAKLKNINRWEQHMKTYNETVAETSVFRLSEDELRESSKTHILNIYEKWIARMVDVFSDLAFAPFVVEQYLDPECRKLLSEKFGEEQGEELFSAISAPCELIEYQKMRLAIYEKKISGDNNLDDLVDTFAWYSEYTYIEPLLTSQDFQKELDALSVEDAIHEKEKLLAELYHNTESYKKALDLLKDSDLQYLAEVIHTYTFLRTDRVDQLKKRQVQIRKIFTVIAEMLTADTGTQRDIPMIVRLLNEEIISYLKDGIVPSIEEIQKRDTENYIMRYDLEGVHLLYGKEDIKRIVDQIHSKESKNQVIKGTIAYRGKHTGRVVKVLSKDDLGQVQKGDVLVARTTQPDYTPAMQKAGAIVTDEGGITSHAAIIARETKTPCIVGCKTATLLFKTGDVVEVDAETGRVMIVEEIGMSDTESDKNSDTHLDTYDFGKYILLKEGGRACWAYISHMFNEMYSTSHNLPYTMVIDFVVTDMQSPVRKRFYGISDQKKLVSHITSLAKNNIDFLNELETDLKSLYAELVGFFEKIDFGSLSQEELREAVVYFQKNMSSFTWFAGVLRQRDRGILGIFEEKFPDVSQRDTYLRVLAVSQEQSFIQQEELAILHLAQKKKLGIHITNQDIDHIYSSFCFGTYGYYKEEVRSRDRYIQQLELYSAQDTSVIIDKIMSEHEARLEERDRTLRGLSNDMLPFGLIAGRIPYLKDLYKFGSSHILYLAESLFDDLSVRMELDKDCIKSFPLESTIRFLSEAIPDKSEFLRDTQDCILIGGVKGTNVLLGEDAREFRETYLLSQERTAAQQLMYKGRVACAGFAVGKAKVILGSEDFHKFEKGDILVAMNTSPDFVAIMGRASAIVAEDGGITAHVSVVSRELGIPCIVGIANATTSFRDGDLLEVDAQQGVVTKK